MLHMGLMDVIRTEREREIESAIRNRRLMRPNDDAAEAVPAPVHTASESRRLTVRRIAGGLSDCPVYAIVNNRASQLSFSSSWKPWPPSWSLYGYSRISFGPPYQL